MSASSSKSKSKSKSKERLFSGMSFKSSASKATSKSKYSINNDYDEPSEVESCFKNLLYTYKMASFDTFGMCNTDNLLTKEINTCMTKTTNFIF